MQLGWYADYTMMEILTTPKIRIIFQLLLATLLGKREEKFFQGGEKRMYEVCC